MVLDPKVVQTVLPGAAAGVRGNHEKRRGLLSAYVASLGLSGLERRHQSLREISLRLGIRPEHRVAHGRPVHEVRLNGEAGAGPVARLGDGRSSCVDGRAALGVHHADLPDLRMGVGGQQAGQSLRRALPDSHHLQPEQAVPGVDERLRGDRSHPALRPRHDGADGEPVRLDRHSKLPGLRIPGDDRVRRDRSPRHVADRCAVRARLSTKRVRSRAGRPEGEEKGGREDDPS